MDIESIHSLRFLLSERLICCNIGSSGRVLGRGRVLGHLPYTFSEYLKTKNLFLNRK